jgi:hypothetical protein
MINENCETREITVGCRNDPGDGPRELHAHRGGAGQVLGCQQVVIAAARIRNARGRLPRRNAARYEGKPSQLLIRPVS